MKTRLALVLPVLLLAVGCASEAPSDRAGIETGVAPEGVGSSESTGDVVLPDQADFHLATTPPSEVSVERDPHPSPWHGSVSVESARDPHPSPWNPPKRGGKPDPGAGDVGGSIAESTSTSSTSTSK
ncbi:MAG: hypothetical protein U0169_24105 [Polyangiaceae bacterium]